MTTRFNKDRYAELKQRGGKEVQPEVNFQNKRHHFENTPASFALPKVSEVLPSSLMACLEV